jgi:hypothetical protein
MVVLGLLFGGAAPALPPASGEPAVSSGVSAVG